MNEESELRKQARDRVKTKRDFVSHVLTYVVINAMLVLVWAVTGRKYPWFIWPVAGWGMGLLAHAVSVWSKLAWRSEDEAVDREMRRLSQLPK